MTTIRMTEETAQRVRTRFEATGRDLTDAGEALAAFRLDLTEGAGQFAGEIAEAAGDFRDSWRAVYEVCGDAAALIAGNTNALHVDLGRLDRGAGITL